ncbi:hypothetical protein BGZ73_008185 [Actinomortierella ambigua]|nr:hypothetical protein BGZ73_008185 [Actinomortierella ambigua]
MDERVRRLTEVLSGIKVVKLYGWESAYLERIRAIREHELSLLRHLGYFFGLMSIIFISAPSIFSLLTFTAFALWGGPNGTPGTFTPKIVFVSLTLFSMLRDPIGKLSDATTCTIEVVVGMRRVQRFLLREELDAGQIERHDAIATPPEGVPMIAIRQATFSWHGSKPSSTKSLDLPAAQGQDPAHESEIFPDNSDECELLLPPSAESTSQDNPPTALRPTLDNITIDFAPQKLTAIVGRVGQGKSSLLSAMLGEMYRWQGTVTMYGRVAYVPQQAWIMNATVRANILFGQEYEAKRYEAIVAACGLEPDLATLPAGDATEIGERGINLSGGQKQRVALARAAYADADVYLLDDPLSAVDAHVDRHLWERLVGPRGLLAGKTRVLVTHGIHHLRQVDRIVVLKDGRVAEQGRYEELMARRDMFYQLIKEYSVAERMERKKKKQNKGVSSHQGGEALEGDVSSSAGSLSEDGLDGCNSDTQHSPLVGAAAATGAGSEDIDTDDTASDGADKVAAAVQEEGKAQRKQDTEAELIKQELLRTGKIGLDVSMIYIKGLSFRLYGLVIVLHLVAHSCNISGTLWLKRWATTAASLVFGDDSPEAISVSRLLGVYSVFALSYVGLFVVIQIIMFAYARVRASRVIHDNLLKRVLRLPMAFFDTTPLGRVINRFSSDMFTIDDRVPWRFVDMVNFGISVMATVCIVLYSTPLVAIVLFPCLGLALYVIQWHYVRAGAVIKRLHTVQLRLLSALLALAVSAAAVVMAVIGSRKGWSALDPGMIGLSMTFVLTWTEDVAWLVRIYGDLQTYLVGLERIQEYTDLPVEAPAQREDWESRPLPPSSLHSRGGHLVFRHYSTRYREGTDLVLRDVSFEVQPGEKIGIVGRTGAGKSSLTLALFRIVEAANSHWAKMASPYANITTDESERGRHPDELIDGGKIEVDGVDISTLGLDDLRHSLAIIPQDPTLFAGTVRDNLDPFGEHQDADLWQALERASLKATVQALPDGLGLLSAVAAQGENFSVGQRSLLCLARALLRKEAKILVLDEATSSVDLQTDEWIQRTIRAEFEDRTILTIAHRIKTVMDYNKILVLDQGRVVEFAAPNVLLQDKQSLFYRLALQAGEVQE